MEVNEIPKGVTVRLRTSFFAARSPEAPSNTMTVSSSIAAIQAL